MDWLYKFLGSKIGVGYTPIEFEDKIVKAGGKIFPYLSTINPASGWVFTETQDAFIDIIAFDSTLMLKRLVMVQKSGKTYYYLARNGASFRCTLP
jgi:hypothetical protein